AGHELSSAGSSPPLGWASPRHVAGRLLARSLAGCAVGGLVRARAPSFALLVVGRTFQGATGAAVPALSAVAVARAFPSGHRGSALGLVASTVGMGQSVGPIVGGALAQWLGWRGLLRLAITLALTRIPFALT